MVEGDNLETVGANAFRTGVTSRGKHRDVAGDHGLGIGSDERRPGVQAHPRLDRRAELVRVEVGAANRDFVDGPVCSPGCPMIFVRAAPAMVNGGGRRGRGGGGRAGHCADQSGPVPVSRVRARSAAVPIPCTCM